MAKKPEVINAAVPENEQQPTRRGKAETTRKFDQTYLRATDQTIHRDIAGHAGRWTFASRGPFPDAGELAGSIPPGDSYLEHFTKFGFKKKHFIAHEKTDVLDVGCGPDRPLMLSLLGGIGPYPLPKSYTGVDMNKIKGTNSARAKLYPETDFIAEQERICNERGPFELITNFEVIEHMPVTQGKELLAAFYNVITTDGILLLSTPVYDGKARAKNHIHEYKIPELQGYIEEAGFEVIQRYGTFANVKDLKKACTPEEWALCMRLAEYYDNNIISTFLAPLYPDASRNNLWVCKPRT